MSDQKCGWMLTRGDLCGGIRPGFHGWALRLPDEFQEKKVECEPMMCKCDVCGYEASIHIRKQGETVKFNLQPKPDAVEEKIKEIVHEFKWSGTTVARKYNALRELVNLARGT